ncbi:MAG: nucleotidyltransferase family protein [Terriglobales bacterium]
MDNPRTTGISEIPSLILAGGLGSRLRPAFDAGPKSIAPIGDRFFLEYLLLQISRAGFHNVLLCVGYGASQVEEFVGDGGRWGLSVQYSVEMEPLGTAGAVKRAASLIDTQHFLVLNGDSFLDIDLRVLVEKHLHSKALATVALAKVHNSTRFGTVVLAADGQIKQFCEKAVFVESDSSDWHVVNGGIYVFSKPVLDLIPEHGAVSLEHEIFPKLLAKGIRGFLSDGYFIDIGLPEDFKRAQAELPEHF